MFTKQTLDQYVEDGWLIKQTHPSLPLTIYNYSQATQYAGKWDEITLACRGLVVDDTGKIVARPFNKFFNIEEHKHTPTDSFEVYEKMDGSLGILFYYGGEWIFASRGSFISEQALKFKDIFMNKYKTSHLTVTNTYLFEIIYPKNRIVVNYGEMEDVVMLGEIHNQSGEELNLDHYETSIFNVVKKYNFKDYTEIQKLNWDNKEGFIVKFSNGNRCKIKFEDYVTLHKIITNVSSYDIWENLKSFGKLDESLLTRVPDEFYEWVRNTESNLRMEYHKIEDRCKVDTALYCYKGMSEHYELGLESPEFRKVLAENIKRFCKYPSIVFAIYDGKDYSRMIWRMIKPKYEKPFSNKNLES